MALEVLWATFLIVAMTIALCDRELETSKARPREEITVVGDIMIISVQNFTICRLH